MKVLRACMAASLMVPGVAAADELALGYFMSPRHPMNEHVFTPFADALAEVSGGQLTIRQFPGGALSSSPPGQYSALLSGVMDITFALPGYTTDLFPMTTTISAPGVCDTAENCTEALLRARDLIEAEYDARLLAVWANEPPVLLSRDRPVRNVADMAGLVTRVTTSADAPYLAALDASPVSQPVSVVNQNLTNGVIDAIIVDPSAIRSFSLHEPANHITVGLPLSGAAFVLLMNNDTYNHLSDEEKAWLDQVSGEALSRAGGVGYGIAADAGIRLAIDSGVEVIELTDEARAEFAAAMQPVLDSFLSQELRPGVTGGDVYTLMRN